MSKSNRAFHPLDIRENNRYVVSDGVVPVIPWEYTVSDPGDAGNHDWSGYWRIEEDGVYDIYIRADDNGYIRIGGTESGFSGHNSSKDSIPVSVSLKKGYHYVELHHENLKPLRDVANAQEFSAYIGGQKVERLFDIDEPLNVFPVERALQFLREYSVADYITIPPSENERVWGLFGEAYKTAATEAGWVNTCAARVSIALNRLGYSLAGAQGANNVVNGGGNVDILNPDSPSVLREHIIISARNIETYLRGILGAPHYTNEAAYSTPQEGDIVIFAGTSHSGMCPGTRDEVGYFISGGVWLLSRSTLDDPS